MTFSHPHHAESSSNSMTNSTDDKNNEFVLPYELWRMAVGFLKYHDLTKLRRVNKLFRSIVQARDFDDAMYRIPLPKNVFFSASSSSKNNLAAPNPDDVDTLAVIGFSQDRCITALKTASNNVEVAADWLFSHSEDAVDLDEHLHEGSNGVSAAIDTKYPAREPVHFIVLRRQGQLSTDLLPAAVHELHPILADMTSWKDIKAPPAFHNLLCENLGGKDKPSDVWTLWDMVILKNLGSVSGRSGELLLANLHRLYTTQGRCEQEKRNNVVLGTLLHALKEQAVVPPLPEWRSVHIQYDKEDGTQGLDLVEGDESTVGDVLGAVLEHGVVYNAAHWESSRNGRFRGFGLADTHRASMLHLVPDVKEVDVGSDDESDSTTTS